MKSPPDSPSRDAFRLRMFAGPNGSGKTSLVRTLATDYSKNGLFPLYYFVNADDMLTRLRASTGVSLKHLLDVPNTDQIRRSIEQGQRLKADDPFCKSLVIANGSIVAAPQTADNYAGAAIADFVRETMLEQRMSFSFETVMSHSSKVEFFEKAQQVGYRTYLYFVATDSPNLNVLRVKERVAQGEHDVPQEKIVSRYRRSLQLAVRAIRAAYRAYVFDNSRESPIWLAEWKPDGTAELKLSESELPTWFTRWITPHFRF